MYRQQKFSSQSPPGSPPAWSGKWQAFLTSDMNPPDLIICALMTSSEKALSLTKTCVVRGRHCEGKIRVPVPEENGKHCR